VEAVEASRRMDGWIMEDETLLGLGRARAPRTEPKKEDGSRMAPEHAS
jgi:hypothetical protein